MSAQPLQKWATYPKLIEHLPGAAPPDIPAELCYLDFAQDKAYLVQKLAEKQNKRSVTVDIAKLVETSTERAFFEMSHNAPTPTSAKLEAARTELVRFLEENPSISRNDAGVREVEERLDALLAEVSKD
ncbi:MAG: hypothetical protein M1832_001613 [Thelocarpon impressellum]|nr:MAG: hypothetical protein M1832_001613 [Thelocarpon impressellum]